MTAFVGSTNLLRLKNLRNEADRSYFNAATVSVTVKDSAGATLTGPLTMSYVAASQGEYRVSLPAALALIANRQYTAEITAVQDGITSFKPYNFTPRTRRGN